METTSVSVLIVDDDSTMAALLRSLLRRLGEGFACETTWVATGAAAREEFRRKAYQLVLLDYQLPDDNGLALLDAVRELPAVRRPAVIMLTGGGNEQVAVEAMKRGALDYLVKGAMSLPALRRSIVAAMERRRLEERLAQSTDDLRRSHARHEADLAMAREVQQTLLPQHYPVLPTGARPGEEALRFCHKWIPSHAVAGDFFSVFPVSDTAAGIFLCDVMGHGVRAALVTTLLRGLLRERHRLAPRPGEFLGALNRDLKGLLERAGDLVFVTATYLVVDAVTGAARLADAGHPLPLHLARGRGLVAPAGGEAALGPALGLLPAADYPTTAFTLEPGDGVLLFTDGIYEVEGKSGEEFGRERFKEAVGAGLHEKSADLLERLLLTAKGFRPEGADGALLDDVCLVAVDFSVPGAPEPGSGTRGNSR